MKKLAEIFIELTIVFLGVFAAFQLSDYKEDKKVQSAKINYYKTFKQELEAINKNCHKLQDTINSITTEYYEGIASGSRPKLMVHRHLFFQTKAFVVESAFNDTHFSTIGSGFIVSISQGANLFYWIDDHLKTYQSNVQNLLYNQPYDPDRFYDENGLKPEYEWYIEDLKVISLLLESLIISIEQGAIPATENLIN